jgi:hypothetical protein
MRMPREKWGRLSWTRRTGFFIEVGMALQVVPSSFNRIAGRYRLSGSVRRGPYWCVSAGIRLSPSSDALPEFPLSHGK